MRVPQLGQSAPSEPTGKGRFHNENDLTLQLGHGFMMVLKFVAETAE